MRFIPQVDDSDCGPACLAMVVDHYRGAVSLARVRDLAGTDRNGTNLAGLVQAGQALGLGAQAFKGSPEALRRGNRFPLIAHLKLETDAGPATHYVVIRSIRGRRITLYDPQFGILRRPLDEFFALWTGYVVAFGPREEFRPNRDQKGLFDRFFPVLRPSFGLLVNAGLASVVLVALGILSSLYVRFLIDDVLPSRSELNLTVLSVAVLGITVFQVLLEAVRKQLLLYFSLRVDNAILFAYFRHVLRLPLGFFDRRMSGDVVARMSQVAEIRSGLGDAAMVLVMDSVMAILVGAVLWLQSPPLFAASLVAVPMAALVVWAFARLFSANYQKWMAEGAEVQAHVVEALGAMATVKALNAEGRVQDVFEDRQSRVATTGYRLGALESRQGIFLGLISGWSGTALYWLGAVLILHGSLTLGQLISFSVLLGFFLGPLQRLVNLQPSLQQALAAAERVGEVFDVKPESDGVSKGAPDILAPLVFDSVRFRYGTRRLILDGLNLVVPRGHHVALVGASGSGKSTVVKLLLRFYEPESGSITLNGADLASLAVGSVRSQIGYVSQEIALFSGTVFDNLCFGKPGATLAMVEEAARRAGALEFIRTLPQGFETILPERGASLSGGERQRLALARALVGNPSLVLFDEATSQLDVTSERRITEGVASLRDGRTTVLMVAHRLTTVVGCDTVHVVSQGRIIESGRHAELLALGGAYAKLWNEGGF